MVQTAVQVWLASWVFAIFAIPQKCKQTDTVQWDASCRLKIVKNKDSFKFEALQIVRNHIFLNWHSCLFWMHMQWFLKHTWINSNDNCLDWLSRRKKELWNRAQRGVLFVNSKLLFMSWVVACCVEKLWFPLKFQLPHNGRLYKISSNNYTFIIVYVL